MKAEDVGYLVSALLTLTALAVLWSYISAHGNGYRDAIREIPLYYEATGEFPNQEWGRFAAGRTLLTQDDVLDMLYPYGQRPD